MRPNPVTDFDEMLAAERAKLRDKKQDGVVASAKQAYHADQDVLLRAPTGMGKTRTFTKFAISLAQEDPNLDVLIVQDRIKVAKQNKAAAEQAGISTALSYDGNLNQDGRICYATSATAHAFLDRLKPYGLVIIDECHHASDDDQSRHSAIINAVADKNPNMRLMGASATPSRSDGRKLHPRLEGAKRLDISYSEALECGAIIRPTTVTPHFIGGSKTFAQVVAETVDPNDPLRDRAGLQTKLRAARPADYFEQCAFALQVHGRNEPTFAFCDTIAEAKQLVDALNEYGHSAGIIHSKMSPTAIENAFDDYESGKLPVLVSVDMLVEGVDITKTSVILNCKTTTTPEEYKQIVGREMRAHAEQAEDGTITRKTKAVLIECGASSLINGTIERSIDVDRYAIHGHKKGEWSPWTIVAKGPDIFALHDGESTIFAAQMEDQKAFKLFIKEETDRRQAGAQLRPHPARTANLDDLKQMAQEAVCRKATTFAALDSRSELQGEKKTTSLRALCRRSYAQSKGSLAAYLAPQKVRDRGHSGIQFGR